nr:polygalacturonase [Quercus suber]
MRRLKELLWHQMDAREYARESDLHKCQGMLLHRVGLIHGRHDRVMIVLEYNVDKRNGTSIYYSQRVIPILVCWSKLLHSIPFAWSSDCLRSTRTLYSIQEYSLQCFLFLPNIPSGYSVQFSRGLVYPISSFKLCYQYGYKMDLTQHHQKLVSKSGWPDKFRFEIKIHLEETNNVKIYNSFISTGDDCMSIGNNSHNVDIRNVTCSQIRALAVLEQINLELVFQTSHSEGLNHQTLY